LVQTSKLDSKNNNYNKKVTTTTSSTMSTPPSQDNIISDAPETPSMWARALGVLSTAKKPRRKSPVDPGTAATQANLQTNLSAVAETSFQQDATSFSNSNVDTSMTSDQFMSPLSPHLSAGKPSFYDAVGNGTSNTMAGNSSGDSNNYDSIMKMSPAGSRRKASRLDFSDLDARTTQPGHTPGPQRSSTQMDGNLIGDGGGGGILRNTNASSKSPWQSNNDQAVSFSHGTSGPSPWLGSRSRNSHRALAAASKPVVFPRPRRDLRTRRYRPNAAALVGANALGGTYQRPGRCDPALVSEALLSLKDKFMPSTTDMVPSSEIFAHGSGKVQWGSIDRPSRTPRLAHKRQRPVQSLKSSHDEQNGEGDGYEGESRNKRRKKVMFNENDEVQESAHVTKIAATPFKPTRNHQDTPMPRNMSGHSVIESSTPASNANTFDTTIGSNNYSQHGDVPDLSLISSTPNSTLSSEQQALARLEFVEGAKLTFDVAQPVKMKAKLDLSNQFLLMGSNTSNSLLTKGASVSFKNTDEYTESSYVRPPSPVRAHKARREEEKDDDDYAGDDQQAVKRTKRSNNATYAKVPDWICSKCNNSNDNDESRCVKCDNPRSLKVDAKGWGDTFANAYNDTDWKCTYCNVRNAKAAVICPACSIPKEGKGVSIPDEAASPDTPAPVSSGECMKTSFPDSFSSGSASKFKFGGELSKMEAPTCKLDDSTPFAFGAAPTSTPAPSTGGPATTGGFLFGGTLATSTTPAASPATGAGTKANATDDAKKSTATSGGFTFKTTQAPIASAPTPASTSTPGFSFIPSAGENGGKTKSPEPSNGKDLEKTVEPASAPTLTFGGNRSGTPPPPHTPAASATGAFVFGQAKKDDRAAATPATSLGSASYSGSSTTPAPAPTKNTSVFTFGANNTPAAGDSDDDETSKPKRQRGYDLSANADFKAKPAPAPPGGATLFASPPPASDYSAGASMGTSSFGNPTPAPANNTASAFGESKPFVFGSTSADAPTPAPGPAAGEFSFGSASASTTPGPASGSFGAPAPDPSTGPAFPFGAANSSAASSSTPAPAFGSGSVPSFGGTQAAPAPFGGSTTFGSSTPAAPSVNATPGALFGQTPGGGAFGSAPTQAPAAGFGATPAFGQGSSGFGSQTPAPTPALFGQTPAPTPVVFGQNPGGPAFGSTPAAGTGFGGVPGSFGSTTPGAPGVSFGNGAFGGGAPPVGPTAAEGGFNIGSAAPKTKGRGQRRIIRAKRPK